MQPSGNLRNKTPKTKAEKRAELEKLEDKINKKNARKSVIAGNPARFSDKNITHTPPVFSPAPSSSRLEQNVFIKYPKFKENLIKFEKSLDIWIESKKQSKNLNNYKKAFNEFKKYIENPSENAKIDIQKLDLRDLPENLEEALLPHVKLDLRDNKFIRLPLNLHLIDDDARLRLEENPFPLIEELAILLFTSYWKKSASLYSSQNKQGSDIEQSLSKDNGKGKGKATTITTFGFHNAHKIAEKLSNVAGYSGRDISDIVKEWRKRFKYDRALDNAIQYSNNHELKTLYRRYHQYKVQKDNVTMMIETINADNKLKRFYDEYYRALLTIFQSAISLANVADRPDVQTQLSITQSAVTGTLTVGAMIAKLSGLPIVTGIGDGAKTALNTYQNYKFSEFNEKVNKLRQFIGNEDVNINAFCETIARFITLSEYQTLQNYRDKPKDGKIIKDPKGVPSTDKKIEERASRMMMKLLKFYEKYQDPKQEPNPRTTDEQE